MYSFRHPVHEAAETGNLQQLQELISNGYDFEDADETNVRPIHVASLMGHAPIVEELVNSGCDVNAKADSCAGERGPTPLHLAARHASPSITNSLIHAGADVDARDGEQRAALHAAVLFNHMAVVIALISGGADVDAKDSRNVTPLLYAAEYNFACVAEVLIRNKADVDERKNGYTALQFVCVNGNVMLADAMLQAGADIDARNLLCQTPLHLALHHCHWEVAIALIKAGASVLQTDLALCSPLHYAARLSCPENLAKLLIAEGADLNARDLEGRTPLVVAVGTCNFEMISILVGHQADVNIPDETGASPLCRASCYGDVNTVKMLLSSGADLRYTSEDKRTPLHYAAAYHNVDICKVLLEKGADVNAVDKELATPLHLAVSANEQDRRVFNLPQCGAGSCKLATVMLLVESGANVNARRYYEPITYSYNMRPLHYAIVHNDLEIVRYLLDNGACFDASVDVLIKDGLTKPMHTSAIASLYRANSVLSLVDLTERMLVAIGNGDCSEVSKCVHMGASVNCASVRYGTPLLYATWRGYLPVVHVLIALGADINHRSTRNATALHCAAQFHRDALVYVLLQHGAMIDVTTKLENKTAVDIAVEFGNLPMAAYLRSIITTFDSVKNGRDELPRLLEELASNNSTDFLLALVNCKNTEGKTLLQLAEKNNCTKISTFLKSIQILNLDH